MKKIMIVFYLATASCLAYGQNDYKKVPGNVLFRFNALYPEIDATKIDWDKECSYYKAEFKKDKQEHKVLLDKNGGLILSESEDIPLLSLPTEARDELYYSEYGTWKIDKINKMEDAHRAVYEVKVRKNLKEKDLYYNSDGQRIDKMTINRGCQS